MPQLNKGGKYVFGWSKIADDRTVHFPPMVLTEYDLLEEQEIIIFTGAKITGGFCVTNQKMLSASKLHKILDDLPELKNHGSILAGTFIPLLGTRLYIKNAYFIGFFNVPRETFILIYTNISVE